MKTYCELYFSGTSDNLRAFVKELKAYINGDWRQVEQSERWEDYLFIDYIGTDVDKARVSIYLGNDFGMEIFAMQGIWGKRSISKKNATNFTLSLAFSFPAPRQLSGNFYDPLHFPVFSSAFLLFIHSSNSRCPSSDW